MNAKAKTNNTCIKENASNALPGSGDLKVFEKRLFLEFCFIKQLWLHPHICKLQVFVPTHYVPDRACRPERKTSPNTDKTNNCARLLYLTRNGHRSGSGKRRHLKLFVLVTVLPDTWRAIRAAGQALQSRSIICSGSLLSIFGYFISFFFLF